MKTEDIRASREYVRVNYETLTPIPVHWNNVAKKQAKAMNRDCLERLDGVKKREKKYSQNEMDALRREVHRSLVKYNLMEARFDNLKTRYENLNGRNKKLFDELQEIKHEN